MTYAEGFGRVVESAGETVRKPDRSNAEYIPIWFHLPPRFYRLLGRVANDAEMEAAKVVMESVKLFQKLHPLAKDSGMTRFKFLAEAAKLIRKQKQSKQKRPDKPLVAYRWEKVPPDERSRIARELARRRWAKRDVKS
jgi:signal transduction histidine kinase